MSLHATIYYDRRHSGGWNRNTAPGVNITDPYVWGHPGVNLVRPLNKNNRYPRETQYPKCKIITTCNPSNGICSQRQFCKG